jgi:hypothetical protein
VQKPGIKSAPRTRPTARPAAKESDGAARHGEEDEDPRRLAHREQKGGPQGGPGVPGPAKEEQSGQQQRPAPGQGRDGHHQGVLPLVRRQVRAGEYGQQPDQRQAPGDPASTIAAIPNPVVTERRISASGGRACNQIELAKI